MRSKGKTDFPDAMDVELLKFALDSANNSIVILSVHAETLQVEFTNESFSKLLHIPKDIASSTLANEVENWSDFTQAIKSCIETKTEVLQLQRLIDSAGTYFLHQNNSTHYGNVQTFQPILCSLDYFSVNW